MRLRKILIAFLCAAFLCSCGSVEKRGPEPVRITYTTPKPFYLPTDEDNIYVLAAGMRKYCPDGTDNEKLRAAVKLLKRVKSDRYPNTLRGVVGEIMEEPREAEMEMAEEILIFGVEQSFEDSIADERERY